MKGTCTIVFSIVFSICANGCSPLDLGEVPFKCNNGDPACPSGYECMWLAENDGLCVKEGKAIEKSKTQQPSQDAGGTSSSDSWLNVDGSALDKSSPPAGDSKVAQDQGGTWDQSTTPQDSGVQPKTDGGQVPHLGCQSNAECTSSDAKCCCPFPGVPQVWTCLPLCLNPICI